MLDTLLIAVGVNAVLFVLVWLVGTAKARISLVDVVWGPSFGLTLMVCLINAPALGLGKLLIATLVLTWSIRLGYHLLPRAFSATEDRRYTAMRVGRSPTLFVWWSLVAVFGLQLVLSTFFSLPFVYALFSPPTESMSVWVAIGLLVATIGLAYESIADWQLKEFLSEPKGERSVCNVGLWRLSRHPNYFGECVFWWGIWLSAIALNAPLWTVAAPSGLTILLLRVSGVSMMESTISSRRPGYEAYKQTTNAFLPGIPKPLRSP
jgi:steroid 5-alpha reductase family enzyme